MKKWGLIAQPVLEKRFKDNQLYVSGQTIIDIIKAGAQYFNQNYQICKLKKTCWKYEKISY